MHRVRVRVLIEVALVLKNEPCLISLAVEGFYDWYVDTMKYADKMDIYLPNGKNVQVNVCPINGADIRPPKRYPQMPSINDNEPYKESELGMKIACGLEMMYQLRKRRGEQGKGSSWEVFIGTLEKSGYFRDWFLTGSKEYQRLMKNLEEYYNTTSLHSKARLRESLAFNLSLIVFYLQGCCFHFNDSFGHLSYCEILSTPPSDDDSWFYGGDEELNSALQERQKEMELFFILNRRGNIR